MDGIQFAMLLVGGIFLVFIVGYLISRSIRLNSEWTGEVINKNTGLMGAAGSGAAVLGAICVLKVKTDKGTKNISVSQGIYERFKIGDKIEKRKGEWNPVL